MLPAITSGSGSKSVWVGFVAQNTTANYSSISREDFRVAYEFNCDDSSRANSNWRLKTHVQGASYANVGVGSLTNGLYDFVFINEGDTLRGSALLASAGHDASTRVFDANDGVWTWSISNGSNVGSHKLIIATVNTTLDLSLTEFNEHTEPVATAPNSTSWTKALDFSGSAERALQVSSSSNYNPLMMGGHDTTTDVPSPRNTASSGYSRTRATASLFNYEGHNSNHHL